MGLLKKIKNVFMANAHDAVDRMGRADKLAKYSIIKMEEALGKAKEGLVCMMVDLKMLEKNREKTAGKIENLKVTIMRSLDDEQVSLELIGQKQSLEKLLADYDAQIEKQRVAIGKMKRQIKAAALRIDGAKNRRDILLARKGIAELRNTVIQSVGVDESIFDEAEQKVTHEELRADVAEEICEDVEPQYDEAVRAEYESLKGAGCNAAVEG